MSRLNYFHGSIVSYFSIAPRYIWNHVFLAMYYQGNFHLLHINEPPYDKSNNVSSTSSDDWSACPSILTGQSLLCSLWVVRDPLYLQAECWTGSRLDRHTGSVFFWYTCHCWFSEQVTHKGCVAQSVMCLATDACLTADPGVASSIPVRSHTFVEIDHEMISTVILLPSADSFKKGCCQL